MQLTLKQLDAHLNTQLLPLYLLSGDECLLVQDARDFIIHTAKKKGFLDRHIIHMDAGFQTETLTQALQNQDLFSEKKIIDIRNCAAKFDKAWVTLLEQQFASTTKDQIIIVSTDKLSETQQKTPWVDFIKKNGAFLPIWPIKSIELPHWIMERCKKCGLTMTRDVATTLADFTQGNLLSTQQAIEKLKMLYPKTEVFREQLMTVLSDHARFNIFDLADSIGRDRKKTARIIKRLEQTGEEPTLVLWAICRKIGRASCRERV